MTEWKPSVNGTAYVEGKVPCLLRGRNERGMWLCDFGAGGKAWLPQELLRSTEAGVLGQEEARA